MNRVAGVKDQSERVAWRALEAGEPPTNWGVRRRCVAPGCDTVLSRYNPAARCTVHGGWHQPPGPRDRR